MKLYVPTPRFHNNEKPGERSLAFLSHDLSLLVQSGNQHCCVSQNPTPCEVRARWFIMQEPGEGADHSRTGTLIKIKERRQGV